MTLRVASKSMLILTRELGSSEHNIGTAHVLNTTPLPGRRRRRPRREDGGSQADYLNPGDAAEGGEK